MIRTLLFAASLALCGPAVAQVGLPAGQAQLAGVAGVVGYQGPGDIAPGATEWWGLRAYNATYAVPGTNPAITIRRASDNTTATINILTTGLLDVVTASSFCSATTCYITAMTDQTGNGHTLSALVYGDASNEPQLLFSCIGSLPCVYYAGNQWLAAPSNPNLLTPYTISMTAERTANFSAVQIPYITLSDQTNWQWEATANTFQVSNAGNSANLTAADSVLHAFQTVFNGSSTVSNTDGIGTALPSLGTASLNGALSVGGKADAGTFKVTGYIPELGVWPIAFTSTQQAFVCHNQNVFFSMGSSC